MNKKGGNGFFIFIVFILLIGVLIFVFMGNKWDVTRVLHEKLLNKNSTVVQVTGAISNELVLTQPPIKESGWCKIQEINVSKGDEEPTTDKISGWDSINGCCVREVTGFNCALMKQSTVKYCYTSDVGGSIVWSSVDGVFIDAYSYKLFIEDLDKRQIENKPLCNVSKYPMLLR